MKAILNKWRPANSPTDCNQDEVDWYRTPEQIEAIDGLRALDIVQVRGTTDFFSHSYFVSNPQVSSDIIAILRYDLRPNEPGRPLEHVAGPFWRVPAHRAPDAPKSE